MGRVDLYILKQIFPVMVVTLFISVVVLLLEKMLQLLNLTVGSGVSSFVVVQMVVSLFPNYIRLVLPLGLFLGVLLTFRRLSAQQELQAFYAGGISLAELAGPARNLALLVTIMGLGLTGYIEPLGRYIYHSLHYQVTNGIIDAGIGEGIFIDTPNGYTIRVERSSNAGMEFFGFFGYREQEAGGFDAVTASRGEIVEDSQTGNRVIVLYDGERQYWAGSDQTASEIQFAVLELPMEFSQNQPYPERGGDPLELTLHELVYAYGRVMVQWLGFEPAPVQSQVYVLAQSISIEQLAAELHGRLIYALSILVMPFFAIPLAIGSPRSNRNLGLVLGITGLLAFQKTIEFGQKVAAVSQLPAGPFLWGAFAVFFGLSLYVFNRSNQVVGQSPFQFFELPKVRVFN